MNKIKNLLIIQARTGSSRLPNKVLMKLCGKPMLQHIIERIRYSQCTDCITVATTTSENDREIKALCDKIGVACYQGSEEDVLDRYYQVACKYEPLNVIRITADCPLIDPVVIDDVIKIHENGNFDYTSNTLVETYPDGLDVEVFKFDALKEAWRKANLASEREHVTPYLKFKGDFVRYSVEREESLAEKRWTVDTQQDFDMITQIYNALYKTDDIFLMQDIVDYIKMHPEIELVNAGIIRNEGYRKSLANDYVIEGDM